MKFDRSRELLARAERVLALPGGNYSRSPRYWPGLGAPHYAGWAHNGHLTDADGNEFIDWVSGLGTSILGYGAQTSRAVSPSLPFKLEIQVAEQLCALVPGAELVRFVKTGSEACEAALRLARAHTQREVVLLCGYHGWHDWYASWRQGGRAGSLGGMPVFSVPYGDLEVLSHRLRDLDPAVFILEPWRARLPPEGYLEALRETCHARGAVLILDETMTAFRTPGFTAQAHWNIGADMVVLGKALGNGAPISAVVGKREIVGQEVLVSPTFGCEAGSLTRARAVLRECERTDLVGNLAARGKPIRDTLLAQAERFFGPHGPIEIGGTDTWIHLMFRDCGRVEADFIRTWWVHLMLERGILVNQQFLPCLAHTKEDLQRTCYAIETAVGQLYHDLDAGKLDPENVTWEPIRSIIDRDGRMKTMLEGRR